MFIFFKKFNLFKIFYYNKIIRKKEVIIDLILVQDLNLVSKIRKNKDIIVTNIQAKITKNNNKMILLVILIEIILKKTNEIHLSKEINKNNKNNSSFNLQTNHLLHQ